VLRALTKQQYCSHLSALIRAGVPLPKSLRLAADAARLEGEAGAFVEGQAIAERLGRVGLFDASELSQLQVAELSGELDKELAHVAKQAREAWQAGLGTVAALLPPILLVLVLVLAGWQLISSYQTTLNQLTDIGK
jgi:type II secretory pathway component PulF